MTLLDRVHGRAVHPRRARVLASVLAPLFPAPATVLDIGSGDGLVGSLLMKSRPDVTIEGIDVLIRPHNPHIPVGFFDGTTVPYPAGSFDACLLVDVVHHADDPEALLAEAVRVSRSTVIVKDHLRDAPLASPRLRLMDEIGNRAHGVSIPYNYWSSARWSDAFSRLGLEPRIWETRLHLYPAPIDWVFGGSLHFIARLERT